MAFAVGAGGRQEFVQADEDHDAGDAAGDQAHEHRRGLEEDGAVEGGQDGPEEERADGLGETGQTTPHEGAAAVARGVVNRHGDGDALGDVVEGDGDGDDDAQVRIDQRGQEGGETLGEVVDGDGQRREGTHAQEVAAGLAGGATQGAAFGGGGGLGGVAQGHIVALGVRLVGVLGGWHQTVNQEDEGDADEEPQRAERGGGPLRKPGNLNLLEGLRQNLHEGDIEHDAGGEPRADGEEAGVGLGRKESNGRTDARGEAGHQSERKGEQECFHNSLVTRPTIAHTALLVKGGGAAAQRSASSPPKAAARAPTSVAPLNFQASKLPSFSIRGASAPLIESIALGDEVGGEFFDEARGEEGDRAAAVEMAVGGDAEEEFVFGAGEGDVEEAALLGGLVFHDGLGGGEHILVAPDDDDDGPFEALGLVDGGEADAGAVGVDVLGIDVAHEGDLGEEVGHGLLLDDLRGEGGDVLDAVLGVVVGALEVGGVPAVEEAADGGAAVFIEALAAVLLEEAVDGAPVLLGLFGEEGEELEAGGLVAGVEVAAEALPDAVDGLGAHAGQEAQAPREGEGVRRADAEAEIGHDVLGVLTLEDALAGGERVGHAQAAEVELQLHHVIVRAVEDGDVLRAIPALQGALDVADDHLVLLGGVVEEGDEGLAAGRRARRQEGLLELLGIAGDGGVGHGEDLGGGAVVALELDDAAVGPPLREVHDVAEVRAAPGVDALEVIAHGHQVAVTRGQAVDELRLDGVGVLVFVHEHVAETGGVVVRHLRVLLEETQCEDEQIVEVHRVVLALGLGVTLRHGEELRGVHGVLEEGVLQDGLEVALRVGGLADERGDDLLLGEVLGVFDQLLEAAVEQREGVRAVENGEVAAIPKERRLAAENAVADVVEGAGPQRGDRGSGEGLRALHHLAGGAVGEGEQQDAVGRLPLLQEPRHAVRQRPRLARPRRRQHQGRPLAGSHRRQLLRVQQLRPIRRHAHLTLRCAAPTKTAGEKPQIPQILAD